MIIHGGGETGWAECVALVVPIAGMHFAHVRTLGLPVPKSSQIVLCWINPDFSRKQASK